MLAEPKRYQARDLDFVFKDTEGRDYFHHTTQTGQSIEHYGKAMEFTMWMSAGLKASELLQLIELQELVIENLVIGKKGSLATLGWVNQEMKLRQEMIIHTELLWNFVACHYIRDDEDPFVWVESLHNEKVEAFKKMCREGSTYDFFFNLRELKNLPGISNMSPEEWNKHWNESIRLQREMLQKIAYLKSELESAPGMKTRKKA